MWDACLDGDDQLDEVRSLLDSDGIQINDDQYGCTLFYMACQNSQHNILRLLNQHDANINQADRDGWTPLIIMTYIGRVETVQLLLSFSTIDTTITFLSKTAIEWAEPNVRATEWKEWETLESYIDEAGRAQCLALLSSK